MTDDDLDRAAERLIADAVEALKALRRRQVRESVQRTRARRRAARECIDCGKNKPEATRFSRCRDCRIKKSRLLRESA